MTNDIALLKLSSDVTYDDYVRQVCLPQAETDEFFDSVVCYTSGWGATSECNIDIVLYEFAASNLHVRVSA